MIQSYKQKTTLRTQYDAIVIGSSMGSLTTAALLSKEGKSVLILEKHYTPGGFTHVFKRKGYEWDVGIHFIEEAQRPNSAIKRMFDYITDGNLEWEDMGEVYDRIIIGDQSYNFVKGVENFKNQLKTYFPDEASAIDQYVNLVFLTNKTMAKFYMAKAMPVLLEMTIERFMQKPFYGFSDRTTYEVLLGITKNEKLI